MTRRIVRHLALLTIVVGAFLVAVPVLAYTDTSPGSGASTSSSTVQPGVPFTFTATFTDLPQGTNVTFSGASAALPQVEAVVTEAEAATCTGIVFNPPSAALDASHSASTQVTIPSSCAGQNVVLTATGPQGQTVSATVTVAGGFPNTAGAPQSLPFGWVVIAIGLLLLVGGTFGLSRGARKSSSEARA